MIIDLILDRKDGEEYNARDFYYACLHYGEVGDDITRALDSGTEKDVKKALCDYVIDNDYNKNICKYINSVNWLESKKSSHKSMKESKSDLLADIQNLISSSGLLDSIADVEDTLEIAYMIAERLDPSDYGFKDEDALANKINFELKYDREYAKLFESKKSVRKSLKEKVTVAKSLKIIEHALLDLIHDDTIQEEFNTAFYDVDGIYDSVDDMFEVSVHNVLNKLLKEHTITVLPF